MSASNQQIQARNELKRNGVFDIIPHLRSNSILFQPQLESERFAVALPAVSKVRDRDGFHSDCSIIG